MKTNTDDISSNHRCRAGTVSAEQGQLLATQVLLGRLDTGHGGHVGVVSVFSGVELELVIDTTIAGELWDGDGGLPPEQKE